MGSSKTFRAPPSWQARNTPGGKTYPSKGAVVKAEGTHMSGSHDYGRKGMKKGARNKSKSGMTSAKNPGPHGYS